MATAGSPDRDAGSEGGSDAGSSERNDAAAGAVGRAVALRRPGFDEVFIADLGVLFGLAIELGDHQPDELRDGR